MFQWHKSVVITGGWGVYICTTENRLKAVREQGVLLQAMTYDGDGNLMYELDYNPETVVDERCIYFPSHGTQAERDLYREICDNL